jgi:hypothetical protein
MIKSFKIKTFAIVLPLLLTGCWETQTGTKVGIITKLARQGLFAKTYEGQIIRGGLNSGSGALGAPFDFTVENDAVREKLQEAMDKNQEVKIYYHKEAFTFTAQKSKSFFVDKVEVVFIPPKQGAE